MDHSSSRPPDPASVFRLCSTVQGTWSHWCASPLRSLSVPHPGHVGISLGSPSSAVRHWLSREAIPRLDRDLRLRLAAMASDLHGVRVDVSSDNFLPARENPVYSFNLPPSAVRLWGLARWGHDLSSTGHPSRHRVGPSSCPCCGWFSRTSPLLLPRPHQCSCSLSSFLRRLTVRRASVCTARLGVQPPRRVEHATDNPGPHSLCRARLRTAPNTHLGDASLLRSLVLHPGHCRPRLSSQLVTLVFYGHSLNDVGVGFPV